MLGEHLAGTKFLRLHGHALLHFGIRPRSKCGGPLCKLSHESVDVGRNWLEIGAILGKVTVFAQGEFNSPAALFGRLERRLDGLRKSLVLDSDLGKRFLHSCGDYVEFGEGIPVVDEGVSDLPKFAFRS